MTIQRCNIYDPLSTQLHKLTGSPPRQRGQQSGEALTWITSICVNIHKQIVQKSEWYFHRDQQQCKDVIFLLRVVHTCCSCCWLDRGNVWDVSIGHSAERSSISRQTRFWKPLSSQFQITSYLHHLRFAQHRLSEFLLTPYLGFAQIHVICKHNRQQLQWGPIWGLRKILSCCMWNYMQYGGAIYKLNFKRKANQPFDDLLG